MEDQEKIHPYQDLCEDPLEEHQDKSMIDHLSLEGFEAETLNTGDHD